MTVPTNPTIGNWGCLLVAYNMQAIYLNLCIDTPDQFNNRAVSKGAFSGAYIQPAALQTIFPDRVKYHGYLQRGEVLNNKVKEYIDNDYPVPCRVDFKPETSQWDQHWILVTGYNDIDFIMVDPWTGLEGYVSEIYGVNGYDLLEGVFYKLEETGGNIDLLPYIKGNGVIYEVINSRGTQERFQSQNDSNNFYQTKNANGECFFADNNYIYRDWDTSPGNDRYYRLKDDDLLFGSRWLNRYMSVGQEFTKSRHVQFYNWDCTTSNPNSGYVTDTMRFDVHYETYTFRTGITLNNVIKLQWMNGGEYYYYAYNYGLVAWERMHNDPNTPNWSCISEIHDQGSRPDNVMSLPSCL